MNQGKPENSYINLEESHEIEYALRYNSLAQSKENKEKLIALLKESRVENKNILWEEVHALISKNYEEFTPAHTN